MTFYEFIPSKSALTVTESWPKAPFCVVCKTYPCLHFLPSLHGCPFTFCVCQRWVSEKLSVESLRDLELFGGEAQGKLSDSKTVSHPQRSAHAVRPFLKETNI